MVKVHQFVHGEVPEKGQTDNTMLEKDLGEVLEHGNFPVQRLSSQHESILCNSKGEVVTEFEKILKDCPNLFKRFDYQRVSPRIGHKVSAGDIHGSDKVEDKSIIQAILGRNLLFSFVRHRSPSLQITIPWP